MRKEIDYDDWLDNHLSDRADDKFQALPDFYKSMDGVKRYTNMEDAIDRVKQSEWIGIARALRDEDDLLAVRILKSALVRICESQVEEELEEEWERCNPQEYAALDCAEYLYQQAKDRKLEEGE